jgi:4-amino-4-deoxy-L-arabinose transferase-like glycosyltransferase
MTPRTELYNGVRAAARAIRPVWLLLGVVLLVHLGVAWAARDGIVQDDAEGYVLLGQNLAAGNGYIFEPGRLPTSWRAPGYPAFLAAIFWLTGGSMDAARIASAFIWVLSAFLAYALARRLVGERPALLAAALVGLSPELVGLTGLLWSETLFTCLFLGSVWAIVRWRWDPPSWWAVAATGALIGAAVLTRSTAVTLFPALWFSALSSAAPAALAARAALATAVGLVVVGTWTVRNYHEHGHFILVESNVGFNLYLGHSHDTPVPFAWKKASRLEHDGLYQDIVGDHSHEARNPELARAAINQIKDNPRRAFVLAMGKAFDFWLPDFFVARNLRSGSFGPAYAKAWVPVLAVTVSVYLLVVALAMQYAWQNRGQWSVWFIGLTLLLYTAPHMLIFGVSRHHLPLMPLVMILAAPPLLRMVSRVTRGRFNRCLQPCQAERL